MVESGGEHTLRGGLVVMGYLPPSAAVVPWNPEWGQAVRRVEEVAVFPGSVRPVELDEPVG